MQFDHLPRARRLVQPVHVLRDDPGQQPAALEFATAWCPAFGAAPATCRQPRWLRAQYRCRAAAVATNVW